MNCNARVLTPLKKSSIAVPSPRPIFERNPSVDGPKGFLISGTRVAPTGVQFKRTISRSSRLASKSAPSRSTPGISRAVPADDLLNQRLADPPGQWARAQPQAVIDRAKDRV